MFNKLILFFPLAILVTACGGDAQKAMETVQNLNTMAQSADNATEAINDMQNLRKERVQRGDTLSMPYQELQKFLPEAINGYTMQEPEGGSVEVPGMSYSNAKATYTNPDGAQINVNITDYNNTEMGFTAATAMFALKMKIDDENETAETFQTDNPRISGYKRVGKTDGRSSLSYSIAGRFYIEIDGSQQTGIDAVQAIANKIKMADLAQK
ncbi:MAG: hypothetical protein HYX66_07635 [Ignavibacteria bacterium]|nr:hypothetical protein [Ignavibacteria bacterium]